MVRNRILARANLEDSLSSMFLADRFQVLEYFRSRPFSCLKWFYSVLKRVIRNAYECEKCDTVLHNSTPPQDKKRQKYERTSFQDGYKIYNEMIPLNRLYRWLGKAFIKSFIILPMIYSIMQMIKQTFFSICSYLRRFQKA